VLPLLRPPCDTRAQAGRGAVVSRASIDSLSDDLLLRALAPLPLLRRLRASAACRRFKRLLYTPALRASLRRAHMLLQGASLAPGGALTSPDDRFRFTFQTDANVVLYYAPQRHRGGPGAGPAVWALQTVRGWFNYPPGRLELQRDGRLVAYEEDIEQWFGAERWASSDVGAAPVSAGFAPPFRLVVRDVGDAAILDADDREAWVAVPERRPWLDDDAQAS
jgi:hypothetical protein